MIETEVEIIEIDKEKVISKLLSLGAKKVFEGELSSVYLDTENKTLQNNKRRLRLRKKGQKIVLTFKKRLKWDEVRTAEEKEVEVDNFDNTISLLES